MIFRGLLCLSMLTGPALSMASGELEKSIPVQTVRENFFIGDVYPSGDVHVKEFVDELSDAPTPWPVRIMFRGFTVGTPERFQFADHKSMLRPNDGVALYKTKSKIKQGFRIVALGGVLPVENIEIFDGSRGRPLAPGEADEIAKKRRRGASSLEDCTTIPAYVDDAMVILTIDVADSRTSLRLSGYENPGCMNHPETIYVLDVLEDGRHQKTYELRHSKGPF